MLRVSISDNGLYTVILDSLLLVQNKLQPRHSVVNFITFGEDYLKNTQNPGTI
jgi:hypothetical protein